MSTILNNNKWATESAAWSSSHCSLSVSLRYTPMPNMWNRFCASSILSTFGMYILNSRHFEPRRQSSVYLWSLWRISSDVSGKKSDCAQCLEIDKNVSFATFFDFNLIFALPKIIILAILAPKRRIDIFFGVEFQMRHFRKFSNTMRCFFQTQVHEDGIFLANDFLSFNSISTGRCIISSVPKMTNSAPNFAIVFPFCFGHQ